ncbi:MAG: chondroitinase-B domain-containing protein [Paludibacter sp.]|nr:chondroitinase-B domain-containing protein [Paludibacter sp.]
MNHTYLIFNKESKTFSLVLLIIALFISEIQGQTLLSTSFESNESYSSGSINNQNNWEVSSGNGEITSDAYYVYSGNQSLRLYSTNTAIQTDNIAYDSDIEALTGDVYIDFWINVKKLPTANFGITGYDLGTYTNRNFMLEFLPAGNIKIYDGSSGWSTQPSYSAGVWKRISIKIDNTGTRCQYAIDGELIDKLFSFREIKSGATSFDFHSIRFSMSSGTANVAIDDIYIGSTPIAGIAFQASSPDRTISITQPNYGTITLDPQKTTYQLNDEVLASISVPEHYVFSGWTGDLSGTENPISFVVDKNYSIGANVVIDTQNPPAEYSISVAQPTGGTITLSPQQDSYYEGTTVTATLDVTSGYQFNGWTGSLSGTTNPETFVINSSMSIGADISEIQVSPGIRTVSTATQFKTALSEMDPGDTIIVLDGTYNIGGVKVTRSGTALKPIIIKSKNLLGAKIIGSSYFNPYGQSYVTYEGFHFEVNPVSTIFKLEGCSYVRITRNHFTMIDSSDSTQTSKWLIIGDLWDNDVCNSHHNRVDHNLFEGKHDQGAWLIIDGSHGTVPDISKHDRIDHNIFRDNTPRVANEKETIRMGVSDLSHKDAFTVVEYNLFEDCDGDPEIVSVKSNCDTVRNNTFRHCLGTVSLRQGNNSVVEGNFMFGEGKTSIFEEGIIGCGGVRAYGLNHKIYNNYFEGLTGDKWNAACTLTNGDVSNSSTSLASHFLPENVVFAFNTFVNNESNIEIGYDNSGHYEKAPKNCVIANNIVIGTKNPLIKYYSTTSLAGVSFRNNIMYPTGSATLGLTGTTESEIKTVNPLLEQSDCRAPGENCDYSLPVSLYKLTSSSPAINASVGYDYVNYDFEGQPAIGIRDIGADEYNGTEVINNGPVDESQAGPTAPETYEYEINTLTSSKTIIDHAVSISPNPFKGTTLLTMPETNSGKAIVTLYNANGQQIQQNILNTNQGQAQISIKNKGLIFCVIKLENKIYTVKLISE